MREYRNTAYHFSLSIRKSLRWENAQKEEVPPPSHFKNVEKGGFQIFITPYNESQVSEERFRQDVPSGVRESLTNVVVDGATEPRFYSTSIALGATREVWFVHDGFLYEVTTLKLLDTWLGKIIQTWEFI